jgi:hypothetical protein
LNLKEEKSKILQHVSRKSREISPKTKRYCVRVHKFLAIFISHLSRRVKEDKWNFVCAPKKSCVCVFVCLKNMVQICTYSSLDVAFLVAVFQVKKMYTWNIYEAVCVFKNINKNTLRVSAHTYTHRHGRVQAATTWKAIEWWWCFFADTHTQIHLKPSWHIVNLYK